ncbi:NAD-dependent epimerase/dehydratase family protein [Mycobacterium sp. 663a-19]|uniref:NAD-dependent epimerase/dehydratase family protein n=1 Tax=Mycobacterium sp. 663a-19 TaxID=2986148 RepID=UPI002D1F6978|nr:NAD-dependent epimerase/dehydratase family protein [Mycobacterium sp. 663a-19]MEB3983911.1 NAD-dependent epimerase/dehydratase family protein [Mycobacterium sp. 663a-19]
MLTWIVGRGGLLGSAVSRAMGQKFMELPVPWGNHDAAAGVLESDLNRFIQEARNDDWSVVWAAGSAVVGSTAEALAAETRILSHLVTRMRDSRPAGRGAFFFSSSAGGIYAGSAHPPFSESTTPRPVSRYGETKLAQEEILQTTLGGCVPLVIGRFSNLAGPGQNLVKQQGLVSQLCRAAVTRQSLNVFVPMETLRDYLYVDDAAAMVRTLVENALYRQPSTPLLRNIASQRPVSVCTVVRTVQQIAHRAVRIALGTSPSSQYQVRDLRLCTHFSYDFQDVAITPFPVTVKRVYDDVLRRVCLASVGSPAC